MQAIDWSSFVNSFVQLLLTFLMDLIRQGLAAFLF